MSLLYASLFLLGSVLITSGPAYSVTEELDVVYRTADGYWQEAPDRGWGLFRKFFHVNGNRRQLALTLDIYRPEGQDDKRKPLLLMLHGGAFFMGSKAEPGQTEWCKHFASLGYVAVSVNYRLGFSVDRDSIRAAEEEACEDAAEALNYLMRRDDLHIDPQRVFVAGTSAGAAIALHLAYHPVPGNACRIRAVGNLWGYVRNLSVLENARVPIVSFQSEQDPVVPYREGALLGMSSLAGHVYGTRSVHERARTLGITVEHHGISEKGHRLHLSPKGELTAHFYEIRDAMVRFFASVVE